MQLVVVRAVMAAVRIATITSKPLRLTAFHTAYSTFFQP